MAKQTINGNYPSDYINVGTANNAHNGETLRSAFIKINDALDRVDANFTELYTATGADAPANQLINGSQVVDLNDIGIITLPHSSYLESIDTNLKVGAQGTVAIRSDAADSRYTKEWIFDKTGTINTPLMLPASFTAILDSAHMVNAVAFTDVPWELHVQFQVNPNGSVQTMIDNIFPILTNPGYVSGYTFQFFEADHGIPGYTFTVTLNDVTLPGGAGWTANIAVSQPPVYPSTIASGGAIKISVTNNDFVFGTNGALTLPVGGDIVDSNGVSVFVNTGNINFVNDDIYNLNGITIENADLSHGATSAVVIPANGSTSPAQLNNTYGSVIITSGISGAGQQWEFRGDGTLKQNYSFTKTVNSNIANGSSVIWTSSENYISGAKLMIQVEANEVADNTGWHSQVCEAIIASRGYANSFAGPGGTPVMTVYGVTYTSSVPLVTFTVQRNPTTKFIEVIGTSTAAASSTPNIRIYSVETATTD